MYELDRIVEMESGQKGDLAAVLKLQLRANKVTTALHATSFVGALQETLLLQRFDTGKPRLPGLPLPAVQRANPQRCKSRWLRRTVGNVGEILCQEIRILHPIT
jgi:hypothetical protein